MNSFSFKPEYLQVYTGEDRTLPLRVVNLDGTPFSLSGATEIEARFKKANNSVLSIKMTVNTGITISDAVLGKLVVKLTSAETELLLVGERQSFTVIFTFPTGIRKVNYRNSLTVDRQVI